MRTQLLCTFAHRKDLDLIVDYVQKSYTISEKRLFVFSNADKPSELYVTYNVEPDDYGKTPNTIMIHRKKETNTLYTVNALNAIIRKVNNGILDKSFIKGSNAKTLHSGDLAIKAPTLLVLKPVKSS